MLLPIVLCGVIGLLMALLIFKEIISIKERKTLVEQIMSRDFNEYASAELARARVKKPIPNQRTEKVIF